MNVPCEMIVEAQDALEAALSLAEAEEEHVLVKKIRDALDWLNDYCN